MSTADDRLDPPPEDVDAVVTAALAEDLGPEGDVTTAAAVPAGIETGARFMARAPGVLAGTAAASAVLARMDPPVVVDWHAHDGDLVRADECVGVARGELRSILMAERSALNLLAHCSGIATLTRRYVDAAGPDATIRDTRKTLPGLRALEKAAVRAGGGENHRMSLSDAVLVKDNHLAFVTVSEAVARARAARPGHVVEVECDTLDQVAQAAACRPDLIMVDNMAPAQVAEAVALLDGAIPVEVSGGVTLDTVSDYIRAGADFVSVGAITHSAPALDLALDLVPLDEGLESTKGT